MYSLVLIIILALASEALMSAKAEEVTTANTRCTAKELEQFSSEYENCHHKSLDTIRTNQHIEILQKVAQDQRPLMTDGNEALCSATDNLIDECTVILGWCFSAQEVQDTKQKQREVSRAALATMNIFCNNNEDRDNEPPTYPLEDIDEGHFRPLPKASPSAENAAGNNLSSNYCFYLTIFVLLSGLGQ